MNSKEQKEILRYANILANHEIITNERYEAVRRACQRASVGRPL